MNLTLSCQLIRRLDADAVRDLEIPSLLLMENAARGAADVLRSEGTWTSISIVCGPGNNGGDGLALCRLLAADNIASSVFVVKIGKSLSVDAEANLAFLKRSGIQVVFADPTELDDRLKELSGSDLIVDALLGTGIRGEVRSPFREVIVSMNQSRAKTMSLDVPSGLDCDSGRPCGVAVEADFTVTFAAMKQGFLTETAARYLGKLTVCHIGLPATWLNQWYQRVNMTASG